MNPLKAALRKAIDGLQPESEAHRAWLELWLRKVATDYEALHLWLQAQPSAGELRNELQEIARVSTHLAELMANLSEAGGRLLEDDCGTLAGPEFESPRYRHYTPIASLADQVRTIGFRDWSGSGQGWPILLRALASLSASGASRLPVSRQLRREHAAGRDCYRDLVVACGHIVLDRGIAVRAELLSELSIATHDQARGVGDKDRRELRERAESLAPRFELLRELEEEQMHPAAGDRFVVIEPDSNLSKHISALRSELYRNIGAPPEIQPDDDEEDPWPSSS